LDKSNEFKKKVRCDGLFWYLITFAVPTTKNYPMQEKVQSPKKLTIDSIPEPDNLEDVVFSLMVNPNLSTINYFNDFSEETITPESLENDNPDESGIFELEATGQSLAITTHAIHHHLVDDPKTATEILVSRAARKMLCFGAQPVALSAFLYHIDFADPNGHSIAKGAKQGLENACRHFDLKITDRKIRFDHFKGHGPVPPTIIISMMGFIKNKECLTTGTFSQKGNNIFMIGRSVNDIGASEYLEFYHGISESPLPSFDISTEVKIQEILRVLHEKRLINSANPVGKGGLFFTLLRAAFPNNLGFDITTDAEIRRDAFLFGESMGRIIVDVNPEMEDDFVDTLTEMKVPFFTLGHVTRGEIRIDDISFGFTDKMSAGY
jgi:phosphoribosylformylglycinamidine synthase